MSGSSSCQCVGALALQEVAPQLERLLGDKEEDVRAAAVEAIARVSREAAAPLLAALLGSESELVSDAIATALKQMDAETVSRALDAPTELSRRAHLLATDVMRGEPHGVRSDRSCGGRSGTRPPS